MYVLIIVSDSRLISSQTLTLTNHRRRPDQAISQRVDPTRQLWRTNSTTPLSLRSPTLPT
jgi:hypothetical protein